MIRVLTNGRDWWKNCSTARLSTHATEVYRALLLPEADTNLQIGQ